MQMGPLANSRRIDMMEALVADAKSKGARVLAGGSRIGNRGFFFPLTVLADVPDSARAMNEEPFGPLALVNPVRDLDEAIEKANSLPFGLAAYAFTRSAHNADRLANDVEAGNLSINHFVASVAETPFGGVKDSGYGREGGTEGLYCYKVAKNVSHKMLSPSLLYAHIVTSPASGAHETIKVPDDRHDHDHHFEVPTQINAPWRRIVRALNGGIT